MWSRGGRGGKGEGGGEGGRRKLLVGLLVALVASGLTGCRTDAAKAEVFITRDGKVVLETPPREKGETIIRVENNNPSKKRVVLLQLDEGQDPATLPVVDDRVPVGKASDLEHRGDGYRVVEQLDTMRPYYGGDQRPVAVLHTYLRSGSYVLLSNLPGDYRKGFWTEFQVGDAA